ncbi:TPA: MATE family efflux transporter [Photobacterium damselae]
MSEMTYTPVTDTRSLLRKVIVIAIPIMLQTLLFSSKGLIDVMMVGQVSEYSVAALGIATKILFVATIIISGVCSAGGILIAQYWGAKKTEQVRQTTILSLLITVLVSVIILSVFVLYPEKLSQLATTDLSIRDLSRSYIAIVGFALPLMAYTAVMMSALRSIEQPKLSLIFSTIGICCNIILNAIFIFGLSFIPALGIKGAALATVISCLLEVILIQSYLFIRSHPLVFSFQDYKNAITKSKIQQFIGLSLPTTLNFLLWSGGLFAYHAIMGRVSNEGVTALAVISPIETISLSLLVGVANASAVIIGNQLGAKQYDNVYHNAKILVIFAITLMVCVACMLYLFRGPLLSIFTTLSVETHATSMSFMTVLCVGIVLRSLPTTLVVGVLRAGGDVKFCLYQDLCTQWLFGIPLTAFAAFVLNWSIEFIYACFFLETLFKWFACIYRLQSYKWIKISVYEQDLSY